MTKQKLAVAVAGAALTTTLVGGVALAGFQPFAGADQSVAPATTAALVQRDQPKDRLKTVLDGLVAKGAITQTQEDAILQAVRAAAPAPANPKPTRPTTIPNARSFVGDLAKAASAYLGMDLTTLVRDLRGGKSAADVANGLASQGKSAQGLIDALTKAANDKVDQAVSANRLSADRATALKPLIAAEITRWVNRSFTKSVRPRPLAPARPSPSPKP